MLLCLMFVNIALTDPHFPKQSQQVAHISPKHTAHCGQHSQTGMSQAHNPAHPAINAPQASLLHAYVYVQNKETSMSKREYFIVD